VVVNLSPWSSFGTAILSTQALFGRRLVILVLFRLLTATAGVSEAASSMPRANVPSVWEITAARYQIDPHVLRSVALQESRRRRPDGNYRAWPWTLQTPVEGAMFFESYPDALRALRNLLASDVRNIDIGIMQINWRWNGYRLPDPAQLLLPERNIDTAAQILRELLNSNEQNLSRALALYHSAQADRGARYAKSVLAISEQLRVERAVTNDSPKLSGNGGLTRKDGEIARSQ